MRCSLDLKNKLLSFEKRFSPCILSILTDPVRLKHLKTKTNVFLDAEKSNVAPASMVDLFICISI